MSSPHDQTLIGSVLFVSLVSIWAVVPFALTSCEENAPPVVSGRPLIADNVVIAGSFQCELGCPGDWQPDCAATELGYDPVDDVWQQQLALAGGDHEYKATLDHRWDENYGSGGVPNGPNIHLSLPAAGTVKFYYDDKTHWVTDGVGSIIATLAGSFQSELGCPDDWSPDCLRSWLQDVDGDGLYTFQTAALPAGQYEVKVAIAESWAENYGQDGVPNGLNIPFTVPSDGAEVFFQ